MDVRADHRKPRVVLATLLIAALSAAFSVPKPVPAQTVITTIPVGDFPTGVAANPSTNRIYAANESDDTVSVIDGVTNSVVATIGVGNGPLGVTTNPATNLTYVSNFLGSTISVIDAATNSVATTISTGTNPGSLDVNAITNRVYAVIEGQGRIAVINGATNLEVDSVAVPANPVDVAVNSATNRIYVLAQVPDELIVIDGQTNTILKTLPIPRDVSLDVNEITNRVYVGGNPMIIINGATDTAVAPVPLSGFGGTTRDSTAVNPATNRIYVADFSSELLDIVDGTTNTRVATFPLDRPHSVAVNPLTNRAYVSNSTDDTVSVIQDAVNRPPVCENAQASPSRLWPPNHKFRPVTIGGVIDPDEDPVELSITGIAQDEPVRGRGAGNTAPDAKLAKSSQNLAFVRAERSGKGDGRVYRLQFTASDGRRATCQSVVKVSVPHNRGATPVDSAPPIYNSLTP